MCVYILVFIENLSNILDAKLNVIKRSGRILIDFFYQIIIIYYN